VTENQDNENLILKKRLNTCRTSKGNLTSVPDNLVIDIIRAWEKWPGTAKSLYTSLGLQKQQLSNIIRKGKKLLKSGKQTLGPFTPLEIKTSATKDFNNKIPIVLSLDKKKSIRFYQVDHLVEFLKKAA
jgi:hypothetical protein